MNATTTFIPDNNPHESDSDTNSDEITPDYYQPISSSDGNDESDHINNHNSINNGYDQFENGVRSLDLSDDDDDNGYDSVNGNHDDDDDGEETRRVEMESAVRRAFEEDENRRNTPLSEENASRVMEAMRGVSFSGSAPDWIRRVPEDRWVHQLQRLRQPGSTA